VLTLRVLAIVLIGACLLLTSCSYRAVKTLSAAETVSEVKHAPEGDYKKPDQEELMYLSSAYLLLVLYSDHVDTLLRYLSENGKNYSVMQTNVSFEVGRVRASITEFKELKVPLSLLSRHNDFVSAFEESVKMLDSVSSLISTRNTSKLAQVKELEASSTTALYDAKKVFDEYKVVSPKTGEFVNLWKR
jgi:flagellar motor switch/type III secretory pathway protein FliN